MARFTAAGRVRSEEHTSELQSPCNLVCRLLLENKNFLDERVARELLNHEVGDVRPRDAKAPSRNTFRDHAVAARRRSVREQDRPHRGPVEVPPLERFEHLAVLRIYAT